MLQKPDRNDITNQYLAYGFRKSNSKNRQKEIIQCFLTNSSSRPIALTTCWNVATAPLHTCVATAAPFLPDTNIVQQHTGAVQPIACKNENSCILTTKIINISEQSEVQHQCAAATHRVWAVINWNEEQLSSTLKIDWTIYLEKEDWLNCNPSSG
jgi:hypothetical protein